MLFCEETNTLKLYMTMKGFCPSVIPSVALVCKSSCPQKLQLPQESLQANCSKLSLQSNLQM